MMGAITAYKKALKYNPSDAEIYRLIGTAYARKGKKTKAYSFYRKYLSKCPTCKYAPGVRVILMNYKSSTK